MISTMSPDAIGEPMRRTDHDVLGRLASIDHRLLQIASRLTTTGQLLLSHLDEIHANLETLVKVAGVAGIRLPRNSAEPASQLECASPPVRSPTAPTSPIASSALQRAFMVELRVRHETVPYRRRGGFSC
jgi:hypothetical protein